MIGPAICTSRKNQSEMNALQGRPQRLKGGKRESNLTSKLSKRGPESFNSTMGAHHSKLNWSKKERRLPRGKRDKNGGRETQVTV